MKVSKDTTKVFFIYRCLLSVSYYCRLFVIEYFHELNVCVYTGSYEAQKGSLEELASEEYDFKWILPGHGRMAKFESLGEKTKMVMMKQKKGGEDT